MAIIITEWALQSYLDLKGKHVFTDQDYQNILRPDVELLHQLGSHTKFQMDRFWGPAKVNQKIVPHGFKMKWRQLGPGGVQLRFAIAVLADTSYLCQAYVKSSDRTDKIEMAQLKARIRHISQGNYQHRGNL